MKNVASLKVTTPTEREIAMTRGFDAPRRLVFDALTEQGGQTTLTLTILYESKLARDTALKSDMEKGVAASYDRLAELLAAEVVRGDGHGRA